MLCSPTLTRKTVSIHSLPPELVQQIFLLLRAVDPPKVVYSYPGWIRVTFVCRRWREVALQSPLLWFIVPGPDLPQSWVLKMIDLSNPAPLSLSLDLVKHRALLPQFQRILAPQVTRRLVHLSILYPDAAADAATFARRLDEAPPTPTLKSLEIRGGHALALSANIFSSTMPHLESLTLKRCFIPWRAQLYHRLIHLDIQLSQEPEYDQEPTIAHIPWTAAAHAQMPISSIQEAAAALQNMPRLQTLRLRDVFPLQDTHTPLPSASSSTPIDLPHLTDLQLEGSVKSCVALVTRLLVPARTNITLYLDCADPAALATIPADLGLTVKSPRELELDFGGRHELAMRMWFSGPEVEGAGKEGERGTYALHVNHDSHFSRWRAMDKYVSLVAAIPLDALEHLLYRACFTRFWLAPEWEYILRRGSPNLREITALGTPADLSLVESVDRWDENGIGRLAPALQRLRFAECEFRGAGSQLGMVEMAMVWKRGSSTLQAVLYGRSQGPSSGTHHDRQNGEGDANELVTVQLLEESTVTRSSVPPPAVHQARL